MTPFSTNESARISIITWVIILKYNMKTQVALWSIKPTTMQIPVATEFGHVDQD